MADSDLEAPKQLVPDTSDAANSDAESPAGVQAVPSAADEVEVDVVEVDSDAANAETAPITQTDANAEETDGNETGPEGGDNTVKVVTPPSKGADEHIHDIHSLSTSLFKNEGKFAWAWVSFTAFYWTLITIIRVIEIGPVHPGFICWCCGVVALICAYYGCKEGWWPSGGTRADPEETGGVGRYIAFGLTLVLCIDFLILSYVGMDEGVDWAIVTRGIGHVISLVWATMFFFNKFHHVNPDIAVSAFFGEWLDVSLTVTVMLVLHNALDENESCLDKSVCLTYYISFIFQLTGWLFPMMLIKGWGTGKDGQKVSTHLFILDLVTDIPIIFAILIQDAYRDHAIILIDVLWKVILTIRSLGYYLVFEIWLQKGQRVFRRNWMNRTRGETLK